MELPFLRTHPFGQMSTIMLQTGPSPLPRASEVRCSVDMRILLVASRPQDAQAVEASLLEHGHTVTSCADSNGGVCRGLVDHEACPLETSVDVAVVARAEGVEPSLAEMGAVCAARHRIGVVQLDPSDVRTDTLYQLADAAELDVCSAYQAAVRARLVPALPADLDPVINVSRRDLDVEVSLLLDRQVDQLTVAALADRARAGVRGYDPHARVIDVSVVQPR